MTRATIQDLYREDGKAELVDGRIVRYPPSGDFPSHIAGEIAYSLHHHAEETGRGDVYTSRLAYVVPELPSGRESFSPDASYYIGPHPSNPMHFIGGPPTFAIEVREECDFGPAAEAAMAAKRADYFIAGTLVVWDVDPLAGTVTAYRAADPATPIVFRRGDVADAEPAVPGWRMAVDDVFNG